MTAVGHYTAKRYFATNLECNDCLRERENSLLSSFAIVLWEQARLHANSRIGMRELRKTGYSVVERTRLSEKTP